MTYHWVVNKNYTTTRRVSLMEQELLTLQERMSSLQFLVGSVLFILSYYLHLRCDVRYDFRLKTMFGQFLLLFCFVGYSCLIMLFTYTVVKHNFFIRSYSCRLTVTQWVLPVEQELLTMAQYTSSPPF
jgi:hypothetical protein